MIRSASRRASTAHRATRTSTPRWASCSTATTLRRVDELRDDAHGVLTRWSAPDEEQERLRRVYLSHTETHPDAMSRDCHPDHLTASAIIFSDDHQQVLLTLHRIVKRWLQTGGHCEPDDATLAEAALREANRGERHPRALDRPPAGAAVASRSALLRADPTVASPRRAVRRGRPGGRRARHQRGVRRAWRGSAIDELPLTTDQSVRALIAAARTRLRGTP